MIVAFGDSLTKGTGTNIKHSYPSILQETIGIEVLNHGVPGELSEQGLQRLEQVLQDNSPDLVILCHGGNDILRRLSMHDLENNLAQMIELSLSYGAEVMLVGVPKPSLSLATLPLYSSLSDEYKLVSNLSILSDLLAQSSMKSDTVHLNSKGYRELAIAIAEKIEIL